MAHPVPPASAARHCLHHCSPPAARRAAFDQAAQILPHPPARRSQRPVMASRAPYLVFLTALGAAANTATSC